MGEKKPVETALERHRRALELSDKASVPLTTPF
jgi:hypothetical protein